MNPRAAVFAQTRVALIVALRTPKGLVFSLVMPLFLLFLFNSVFIKGGESATLPGNIELEARAYFTAGIIAYSVAISAFTTPAISITTQRERGQLKRLRGTPIPPWTFIVAQILRAAVQAVLAAALMLAASSIAYGIPIPGSTFPAFVLYLLLGTATLCSLGIAVTAFSRTVDSVSAVATFAIFILSFFSGIFVAVENLPHGLEVLGKVFPLYHLALGLQTALAPGASGSGLELENVLILAIWAVAGVRIASRRFRWEPQAGSSGG